MFLTLLKKECVQYLKSITYYIFLIALVLDFISQMGTFDVKKKPEPGGDNYGMTRSADKDLIMKNALDGLLSEYDRGEYTTYPIGFYKRVTLNDEEQEQVKDILLSITGLTEQELKDVYEQYEKEAEQVREKAASENRPIMETEFPPMDVTIREDLTWEEFSEKMQTLDDLLGGGSDYSKSNLEYTKVPMTYEQALDEYESLLKDDKVTNAYARLFCDYMGIVLAILPVLMSRAGSAKIILSRYLASIIVTVVPVILCSCSTLMQSVYYARSMHVEYDLFAFIKHIGFWLLPMILVSLSVGFFLTELTDSAIAILVQAAWWFFSIFVNGMNLVGSVGWNLVPRFNTVGSFEIYRQMEEQLMKNRLMYTGFALVLILFTVVVYNKKRKGEFVSVGTVLRNRKNKLEA